MKKIPVSGGHEALVDDEDFEMLSKIKWYGSESKSGKFYVRTNGNESCAPCMMHRLIMNPPDDMHVDHINGDTLDNRRENLRVCTHIQNQWNNPPRRRRNRTSPFKGVIYKNRERCIAQLYQKGKVVFRAELGSELAAVIAYDMAAREHQGDYAYQNVPLQPVTTRSWGLYDQYECLP